MRKIPKVEGGSNKVGGVGVTKKAKKRAEKAKKGLKIAIFGTFSCESVEG